MSDLITPGMTANAGRDALNAKIHQLYQRFQGGPRNRVWMAAEFVSLGPTTGWYDLGLEFPVEAGITYRFHAGIFFGPGSGTTVGFSVDGPGTILTTSYPERLAYWTRVPVTTTDDGWENASRFKRTGSNFAFPTDDFRLAEVWGIVKPNLAGTLQVLGRRNAGGANVYKPSYVEWW